MSDAAARLLAEAYAELKSHKMVGVVTGEERGYSGWCHKVEWLNGRDHLPKGTVLLVKED